MPTPSEEINETRQPPASSCVYEVASDLEALRGCGGGNMEAEQHPNEAEQAVEQADSQGEEDEDLDDEDDEEDAVADETKTEYPPLAHEDVSQNPQHCDAEESVTQTNSENGYVVNVPHPAPLHHQQQHHLSHPRGVVYPNGSASQVHTLMLGSPLHHGASGAYVIAPTSESEYQHLHHPNHQHLHHHPHPQNQNQVFMTNSNGNSNKEKVKPKRKRVISCEQRKAANIRERRRMTSLNVAFDILRKAVPTFHYEKKLSRIETLKLAIQYIYFMTEVLNGKDPKHISMTPRLPMFQGMMGNMIDPGRPGRRGRRRKEQNPILMHHHAHAYPFLT